MEALRVEGTNKQTQHTLAGVVSSSSESSKSKGVSNWKSKFSTVKDNVTKHKTLNPGTEVKPMYTHHLRSWSHVHTEMMGLALKVLTLDLKYTARI